MSVAEPSVISSEANYAGALGFIRDYLRRISDHRSQHHRNMSSLVYFGSKPSANQLVSAENSLRNIRLCRAMPGALNIVGVKEFTHPSYELYIKYLPFAIKKQLALARPLTPADLNLFTDTTERTSRPSIVILLSSGLTARKSPRNFLTSRSSGSTR